MEPQSIFWRSRPSEETYFSSIARHAFQKGEKSVRASSGMADSLLYTEATLSTSRLYLYPRYPPKKNEAPIIAAPAPRTSAFLEKSKLMAGLSFLSYTIFIIITTFIRVYEDFQLFEP